MKINIPLMVQDPALTLKKSIIEGFEPTSERILLDGPTTDRLAVIDFDPDNGDLVKGATLVRPSKKKKEGYYVGDDSINLRKTKGKGIYSPPFMQVSTFATVLKTMYLFEGIGPERIETLGRPVKWAFNAPQLLVVPRAGVGANAYYHRDSHSLQFLIFKPDSKIIYTCLSRDIVAHETGHAIVDGIAPDLLDACTPHSLALHEAMADLTALLMAFNSNSLRTAVLAKTRGSLQNSTEFTSIAEEFGGAYLGRYLRNMKNRKTLNPDGGDERVDPLQPHDLSQVLSGALYDVLVKIHEKTKKDFAKEYSAEPQKNNSGYALYKTASWFKRMIFRALDYLPAGEVSFVDYGRALIAVDKVAYPDNELWRDWIRDEFMNRWIVRDKAQLTVDNSYGDQHIDNVQELIDSEWAAYDFTNKNRDLLVIPEGVQFLVRDRMLVTKKYDYHTEKSECILKVSWEQTEKNELTNYPKERLITLGTTISIDYESGKVIARLTNSPLFSEKGAEASRGFADECEKQRILRTQFLRQLDKRGLLQVKPECDPEGHLSLSSVQGMIVNNHLRLRGTGKMLHILGGT